MSVASVQGRSEGDDMHIQLAGEIDLSNAEDIEAQIASLISNQVRTVEIDMTAIQYLDSAGLRVLYSVAERLRRLQIGLRFVAPSGSAARHVLEASGMANIAPLHD